jgi:hypothetical protein
MEPESVVVPGHSTSGERWRVAAAGLLVAWLGTTAWLFWTLETTGLPPPGSGNPATQAVAVFDPGRMDSQGVVAVSAEGGASARVTVVHLRDAACSCTRAADAHFEALVRRHRDTGIVFAIADAPGTLGAPIRGLAHLPRIAAADAKRIWRDLPSAPAVAVFDAVGQPVYLGPYADAARCGAARGGLAEAALAAVLDFRRTPSRPLLATGCFCKQAIGDVDGRPRQIAFN